MPQFIDLDQFKPKPHPFKAELKKHGVSCSTLRNYLGLNYTYTNSMLNGHFTMPKKHELKIKALLNQFKLQALALKKEGHS